MKKEEGLKTILIEKKQNSSIEIMQYKEDNKKDYSHVVKVRSSIESQENDNRKDDMIEAIQKKKLDVINGDKEKGIIRKGIVK